MLSKGFRSYHFLLMRRIVGFMTRSKGVVCPFLAPRVLVTR